MPRRTGALRALTATVALAGTLAFSAAQAATISLSPQDGDIRVGDTFTLDLLMDFTDVPTLGGGIDVKFDRGIIGFEGFAHSDTLGDDPSFRFSPIRGEEGIKEIGFGSFGGLRGPATVGTLTFTALGEGETSLLLGPNDTRAGGFFSAVDFGPQSVEFVGTDIKVSAVPLPAAAWMLLSAMGVLALRRRHRG